MPPWRTTVAICAASAPLSRAMMTSASSEVWRCWASKSAGTYSASIAGVAGSTLRSRIVPPEARASDTAVSIADLARSVSARSTGTRIRLNMSPSLLPNGPLLRFRGDGLRGHVAIEPPGLAMKLRPGVDRKIDHRQRCGRKLLRELFAALDVARRD